MSKEEKQKDIEEESFIDIKAFSTKKIKPQLFIDTGTEKIDISEKDSELVTNTFKETDKYSVTPTTFKARTLFLNPEPIVDNINKDLKNIYIQKENINIELSNIHKPLQNLHSINIIGSDELKNYEAQIQKPVVDPLKAKLRELEGYEKTLIQYQHFVKGNNGLVLSYQDIYAHKDNAVARYGINISEELAKICNPIEEKMIEKKGAKSKASSKSAKDEQDIPLHPLEVLLIKDAIGHLSKNTGNTVLVDIFARESDGKIKLQGSKPETHTIVLYNNKKELLVIDPSNSDFSKHLASNTNKMLISSALGGNVDILVSPKQLRIYEPINKDNIGPTPDLFRDCIDIAVKLAFGLNQLKSPIDIKNIESLNVVKQISNNNDINDSIPDDVLNEKHFVKIPLRIQQKSNIKIEEDFYKFLKTIKQNLVDIKNKIDLENYYVKTLFKSDTSSCIETLKSLYSVSESTFTQLHKELEETQLEVLGKGFNSNIYDEV